MFFSERYWWIRKENDFNLSCERQICINVCILSYFNEVITKHKLTIYSNELYTICFFRTIWKIQTQLVVVHVYIYIKMMEFGHAKTKSEQTGLLTFFLLKAHLPTYSARTSSTHVVAVPIYKTNKNENTKHTH